MGSGDKDTQETACRATNNRRHHLRENETHLRENEADVVQNTTQSLLLGQQLIQVLRNDEGKHHKTTNSHKHDGRHRAMHRHRAIHRHIAMHTGTHAKQKGKVRLLTCRPAEG